MNITTANCISTAVHQFILTATAQEFETAVQATYQESKASYALAGYAPGEAPREAIEEKEGEAYFYYGAVNVLLAQGADELLQGALAAATLTPLTTPDYNVTQMSKEGFAMEITLGTMPAITLGQYKDRTFAYPPMPIPPDAVENQLGMMRQQIAKKQGTDTLPALDDAFAQLVSDCNTLGELREKMTTSLHEFAQNRARTQGQFLLLEAIGQDSQMELPEYLLKKEYETAMKNLETNLEQYGVPFETYLAQQGKTKEEFETENNQSTLRAVRAKLSAYAIAQAEGITISDAELESEMVRTAARYKQTVQQFKAEHPAYLIKNDLMLTRAIAFLAAHNTLTAAE